MSHSPNLPKRSVRSVFLKRLALTALLCAGTTASAADLTVTNTNDHGTGSLRQAILEAQPNDRILFDASLAGSTITLSTSLGAFTPNLTIDSSAAPGLTIQGANLSSSPAGQLNLVGDATYNTATLSGDTGIGTGANLNFVGGTITGNVDVTKDGVLTTDGTITGNTSIANGATIVMNGSVSGTTTLAAGGTLMGNGNLDGDTTSSGTMNPGAAGTVDTLNFGNDLTIDAGAIQVDTTAGGTVPGTHNDLYDVTGNVQINGGIVEVIAQPGAYVDGSVYTFLDAATLSGTFDGITDNLAFYDATLSYTGSTASFMLTDNGDTFASVGVSCNQKSIGAYLDAIKASPPPPLDADLENVILYLRGSTTSSAQTGLEQLGGHIYGSLPAIQLQHTSFTLAMLRDQLVFDRLYRQPNEQTRAWVRGYGIGGDADPDACATQGFDYSLGGTEIAVQRGFANGLDLGLFTNLAWSKVKSDGKAQEADVDSYQYGLSMQYLGEKGYVLGIAGAGNQNYKARRRIYDGQGLINRTAQSKFDGSQAYGSMELGTRLQHGPVSWIPHFAMQYIALDQDGVRETGADSINLLGNAIDTDSLRSILGMSVQQAGPTAIGPAITKVRAGWMHEYLDADQVFVSSFEGADAALAPATVKGINLGRDWAVVGLNLQWSVLRNLTTVLGYQGQFNKRQELHTGAAGLEARW